MSDSKTTKLPSDSELETREAAAKKLYDGLKQRGWSELLANQDTHSVVWAACLLAADTYEKTEQSFDAPIREQIMDAIDEWVGTLTPTNGLLDDIADKILSIVSRAPKQASDDLRVESEQRRT